MTGSLVLLGVDPCGATPPEIAGYLAGPAVVLPTASAYEHPRRVAAAVTTWLATHGVASTELDVLTRRDTTAEAAIAGVRGAATIVVCDGTAMHARSVLKDTPLWEALVAAHEAGATVVAAGAGATVLCDPLADSRGGGLTLGLGLVRDTAVLAGTARWPVPQVKRMRVLAGESIAVATVGDDGALVRTAAGWRAIGAVEIHRGGRAVGLDALPAVSS